MLSPFELYDRWRVDLDRYRKPVTARLYRRTAFAACADLGGHPVQWSERRLRRYLEDELTPAQAKLTHQAINDFLEWMVRKGYRDANPLEPVRVPRRAGRRIKRALTRDELEALLAAVRAGSPVRDDSQRYGASRERLALIILANRYTGLRPGEMCNLLVSNVFLPPDPMPRIEVLDTKTGNDREVPLSLKAVPIFAELVRDRVGRITDFNSRTYWDLISKAAARAAIPPQKRRPYALRHMFATDLLLAGVKEREIRELMGHTDTRALETYTARDYEDLRGAVEVLA